MSGKTIPCSGRSKREHGGLCAGYITDLNRCTVESGKTERLMSSGLTMGLLMRCQLKLEVLLESTSSGGISPRSGMMIALEQKSNWARRSCVGA